MVKLCFVGSLSLAFARRDYEILKKYFDVDLIEPPRRKIGWLKYPFIMSKKVKKCDVIFCWFAGWHSAFAVHYSKKYSKKSIAVAGGYDVALTYSQHLGLYKKNDYRMASPLTNDAKSGYVYDYMLARYFKQGILFQIWDAVIKKTFLEDMQFDTSFTGCEDDFLLRLAKKGRFIFIPEILQIQNLDAEGRISTAPIYSILPPDRNRYYL